MSFTVVHRRDLASRFGLSRTPSPATIKRWQRDAGFPRTLEIPRGHFIEADVAAWLASRGKSKPTT